MPGTRDELLPKTKVGYGSELVFLGYTCIFQGHNCTFNAGAVL